MTPADLSGEPHFSAREVEVLALICRGLSNAEVADQLYLSINSVKTYVRTAYQKIGLTRRSQVIVWALDRGYSSGENPWPVVDRKPAAGRTQAPRQRHPDGPRQGWQSSAFSGFRVGPTQLAGETLAQLGLPRGDELLTLAELGITTLDSALTAGRSESLTDYLVHAVDRLAVLQSTRIDGEQLASAMLRAIAARAHPATVEEVDDFVRTALAPLVGGQSVRTAEPVTPLGPAARAYLDQVLAGEPGLATAVVLEAIKGGMDLGDVLVDVLEAAQREIGRLWQVGLVSVDEEYFCTAVTQSSMTALYPYLFTGRDVDRRLVAVHAPGSLHQVGLQMVTDLLEHEGWSTTYLGSDVTADELPDLLVRYDATVLLISGSMASQTEVIRAMIDAVRADDRTRGIPVAVGGRSFLVAPALVDAVGADGWAPDARAAVVLCNRLAEDADARA